MQVDYESNVRRKVPLNIRVIRVLLYISVLVLSVFGAMWGAVWLVPSLATLIGTWYFNGETTITYHYLLTGKILYVDWISGFKSHPRKKTLVKADLSGATLMVPEDHPAVKQMDSSLSEKPVTYDVSEHDPEEVCDVLYAAGMDRETGRTLKIYCRLSPRLRECITSIAPGIGKGYDEDNI